MSVTKQVSAKVLFKKLKKHIEAARAIRNELEGPPSHMLMEDTYTGLKEIDRHLYEATNSLKTCFYCEGMPFKQKLQSV